MNTFEEIEMVDAVKVFDGFSHAVWIINGIPQWTALCGRKHDINSPLYKIPIKPICPICNALINNPSI